MIRVLDGYALRSMSRSWSTLIVCRASQCALNTAINCCVAFLVYLQNRGVMA